MDFDELLETQADIVSRTKLRECGISRGDERAQVDAGRWRALNDAVLCTHNGPLTTDQARWAVVLSAQGLAALCGLTAIAIHMVRGFETHVVHVLVQRGARVLPVAGVEISVHESRRFRGADVLPMRPPATPVERATIDAAVWSPDVKTATRVIVAAIQQRRTTAVWLREELAAAGPVRFGPVLRPFLADLEGVRKHCLRSRPCGGVASTGFRRRCATYDGTLAGGGDTWTSNSAAATP